MAKIYNSELFRELTQGGKIQTSIDRIPSELAEKVVPVMEVNPKLLKELNIIKNTEAFNTTSATIYTTPSDKDFYLTGYALSVTKDAGSTSQKSWISCTINGATTIIVRIETINGQIDSGNLSHTFLYPIKIDKNTTITVNNSTAVASIQANATIYGYEEYNNRA